MTLAIPASELATLTGLTQPAAQMRRLRAMGIRAERNGAGEVIVLREWLAKDCRTEQQEPELNL